MNRPYVVPALALLVSVVLCAPAEARCATAGAQIEVAPVERVSKAAPFPVGWEDDVDCAGWIG